MPLSKYHIRNEHSLADPEMYRSADKDDPEALLEAVSMAAHVGLLRQLGDLTEFAAAIFHNLHEEVMVTVSRGHSLMGRVQQLEAEVPSLEKAFYSQTHHSSFFTNGGIGWHPNHLSEQNLVTRGDLPRFVMDSYEECRGPPRLFLLDKFDVAGAGACLKRYTDPSFFKMESASFGISTVEVHRGKRSRKVKQKKGARLRDDEAPIVPPHSKLHQLLLEDRIENGYSNPARLVKLKKRQLNGFSAETTAGKSYMEKFLQTPSPDLKMICETSIIPQPVKLTLDDTSEAGIRILEISSIGPVKKSFGNHISPNEVELEPKPFSEVNGETYGDSSEAKKQISACGTVEMSSSDPKLPRERELAVHEQQKIQGRLDEYHSDDVASEVDNYMDILTTMESELKTDIDWKPKKGFLNIQKVTDTDGKEEHQLKAQLSDSQSFGDSSTSDDISSFKEDGNGVKVQACFSDSHSTGTSSTSDSISSFRRDGNEHIELQAHFSDSQSVDNSSTSNENNSFKKDKSCSTHSDSLSTVVGTEPILFRYAKYHEPEVEDISSNQIPQIVELQNTDCDKVVLHDDANVKEISDFEQTSSDLVTIRLDFSSASPVTLPAGTQLDETPSDPAELNLRLKDNENRTGLVESIAVKPVSLSLVKDDAFPVDSFDKKSLNNLEGDDPYVHSDGLLQVPNDLDSPCEDDCIGRSNENSSEILVSRDAAQGVDLIFPSMENLDLNSGTMSALDSRDSKDEDCTVGTQPNLEDLSPVHPVSCFTGEVSSDLIHDSPRDEPSSAEIEVLHSDLQSCYSSGQVINPTKHVTDPLKSPLPDLFPKANENSLDEMPPLPPLPPMQWRMGKVQHASLISQREHVEVNWASAQPMQPTKTDKKSQSGFPTSERDTILHQNPVLPVMAVESDKLQQCSGFPVGVPGNPVAIPFQFPIMVNDANGIYNYVLLDRNQIQNPFLALPVVSSERPPHGYIVASEGEMLQNSNLCSPILPAESAVSGHDSISPPGNLSQITAETSSEVKTLQLSISNLESTGSPLHGYDGALEGEMLRSSNQYLTPPPAECAPSGHDSISPHEKPTQSPSQLMMETSSEVETLEHSVRTVVSVGMAPHGYAVASEGEILQNSNPSSLVSSAECSVSGHHSASLQENQGQSMIETSSEVKTPNQSMSNMEGEKGHPFISIMSPPHMESMEPNQSFLSSAGEMPSSFDTYAQTSDFESERINGKPKTKQPRPRNPLIDAVVAHDKSKLRRVTERVMPLIAPNVEERDSLLEQIRTKSFNLKPAVPTRPSIQGPKTNLKLAAILEKANAIRHTFAGSDEDDDADSWSDS